MIRTIVSAFLLSLLSVATIFSNVPKVDVKKYENQVLMTLGKEQITFGEVKKIYDKNTLRKDALFETIPYDSARHFLDLYARYKMRVNDGIKSGYDKHPDILAEIAQNKRILAEGFLLETEVIEPNIKRYTQMRKVEKKIAIILVNFSPTGDTNEAYRTITAALSEIKNGESFEYAAAKFSSDSISGKKGGLVDSWVTAMRLQPELENAIYALKVGEMTKEPIKTNMGYFLIKLVKEEPRIFIGASHILIPLKNDNPDLGPIIEDEIQAIKLGETIYNELLKGANFLEQCAKFTSDRSAIEKGCNMGIYARSSGVVGSGNNIMPELEDILFNLKDGEICKPFLSEFGVHIAKRDSTVTFPDDFEYNELKANYNRLFFPKDKENFYDSLAVALCGYKLNETTLLKILQSIDTSKALFDSSIIRSIPLPVLKETIYSIDGQQFSVQSLMDAIDSNPQHKIISANRSGFIEIISKIIRNSIIDKATEDIQNTRPQFQSIIEDFASGLIKFKAEEENVWKHLIFDTTRAKKYYDTTKTNLNRPEMWDISEIYLMSKEKADEVYEEIKSGKLTFDSAAALYTQRQLYREKHGRMGPLPITNRIVLQAKRWNVKEGTYSDPIGIDEGWSLIRVNSIEAQRRMTFEEALPSLVEIVQTEHSKWVEDQWQKRLDDEYPLVVNEKLMKEIFK